jgi:hypothetical protein
MNSKKFSEAMGEVNDKYYEEAANYQPKRKKNSWVKWGAMAACVCLIVAVAIPLVNLTQDKSPLDDIQRIEFNNAYYEVCEDNVILKRLGLHNNITEADARERITYLTKKTSAEKSEYIATEEKTNIILYAYAAAPCEAVYVICDNGEYNAVVFCNYVLPDTETVSLERLYSLYDVKNAWDISSISVVDDWFKKNVVGATITDENVISDFYSSSLVLQDYSNDAYHEMNYGHIATEEELLQAYDKTAENKLTLMLETPDGLRFCLEYDAEGGWIYSNHTMRYYRVTEEIADWFSNNLK